MKSKIIFAAFVLAALTISATRAEAQEKLPNVKDAFTVPDFRPRGVFALVNHGDAPTEAIWKNPCIDGVRLSRFWSQLNPEENNYKWNELDRMFQKAKDSGKRIHLIVIPGFRSPAWVLQKVETRKFKKKYFSRQVFEYAIRNDIGYGGDFIEIYDEDIRREYLQDWIAYASVFMGGQLSEKEVEKKCECLKSVKFKLPSRPMTDK